jgi:hypothetical protein
MKITQATVKTIYDIEIDFGDFLKAYIHYNTPEAETERILYPRAFEGYDLDNHTTGYVDMVMQKISVFGHGDFAAYMAHFFEFDGWSNMGHYHKPSGKYRMTVFRYGDCAQGGWMS